MLRFSFEFTFTETIFLKSLICLVCTLLRNFQLFVSSAQGPFKTALMLHLTFIVMVRDRVSHFKNSLMGDFWG